MIKFDRWRPCEPTFGSLGSMRVSFSKFMIWTTRWANLLLLMFAILLWIRSSFKLFRTICSRVKFKWSLICFRNILSWFFRWIVSNQQLSHPLMDAPEFRWLKRNHDSGDNRTDHCAWCLVICFWFFHFVRVFFLMRPSSFPSISILLWDCCCTRSLFLKFLLSESFHCLRSSEWNYSRMWFLQLVIILTFWVGFFHSFVISNWAFVVHFLFIHLEFVRIVLRINFIHI